MQENNNRLFEEDIEDENKDEEEIAEEEPFLIEPKDRPYEFDEKLIDVHHIVQYTDERQDYLQDLNEPLKNYHCFKSKNPALCLFVDNIKPIEDKVNYYNGLIKIEEDMEERDEAQINKYNKELEPYKTLFDNYNNYFKAFEDLQMAFQLELQTAKMDGKDLNKEILNQIIRFIHNPKDFPGYERVQKLFDTLTIKDQVEAALHIMEYAMDINLDGVDIDSVVVVATNNQIKLNTHAKDVINSQSYRVFADGVESDELDSGKYAKGCSPFERFKEFMESALKKALPDDDLNIYTKTANIIQYTAFTYLYAYKNDPKTGIDTLDFDTEVRDFLDSKIDGVKECPKALDKFYENLGLEKGKQLTDKQISECKMKPGYVNDSLNTYQRLNEIHAKRGFWFFLIHPNQNSAEKNALATMKSVLTKLGVKDEDLSPYKDVTVIENGKASIKKELRRPQFGDDICEAQLAFEDEVAYEKAVMERADRVAQKQEMLKEIEKEKVKDLNNVRKSLSVEDQKDLKERTETVKTNDISKTRVVSDKKEKYIDSPTDDF